MYPVVFFIKLCILQRNLNCEKAVIILLSNILFRNLIFQSVNLIEVVFRNADRTLQKTLRVYYKE
jgi:hypothetical protein